MASSIAKGAIYVRTALAQEIRAEILIERASDEDRWGLSLDAMEDRSAARHLRVCAMMNRALAAAASARSDGHVGSESRR
jgi:hypothetical protein